MGRHSLRESDEPAPTSQTGSTGAGDPGLALLSRSREDSSEHTAPIPIVSGDSTAAEQHIPTQRRITRSLPLPIVSMLEPDEWFSGFEEPGSGQLPSGDLPSGDLPSGDLPSGDLPSGDLAPRDPAPDDRPTDTAQSLPSPPAADLPEQSRHAAEPDPMYSVHALGLVEQGRAADTLPPPIRVIATPVDRITPLPRPSEPVDIPLSSEAPPAPASVPPTDSPQPPRPQPSTPPEVDQPTTAQRGPRLLLGGGLRTLAEHTHQHGPLPKAEFAGTEGADQLLALVERSGLRGRGGSGFATARKMMAVRGSATPRRRPVVVANGCEGDPTSGKDELLLYGAPHLVLDGIALAAHAVGADQAILCLHRGSPALEAAERAIAERHDDPCALHVVTTPTRFVSSEASALVNFLTSGDARPTTKPPRTSERGVQGRPTLVDNVETLAHLALLARHGEEWFRTRGTHESPGTMLMTLDGAVHQPGVYEVDMGTTAGQLIRMAGGTTGRVQAMLLGGFGGNWLPLPSEGNQALSYEQCRAAGLELGVTSLVALPLDACGLGVTSAILDFLASESAGQCGPCMFGLPALAQDFQLLTSGRIDDELAERMRRRINVICGRGACSHPDGALRLAASALRVFDADVERHLAGEPCGRPVESVFPPLAELPAAEGGWR
ncbi:MAG TPA: NADH-ubiquinone oxidoreductase-F iron-sulfur binding region domain-containing protein [Pseudonocardia sp.]|jgi:NADH:ubiquinone oxidoreductase subunit F (NADH-binding)|nr:NADH-ubiquinone oxidoreductase-F iron-sulfur binding region domain-containing protein [Pseudonocardia sp.]